MRRYARCFTREGCDAGNTFEEIAMADEKPNPK